VGYALNGKYKNQLPVLGTLEGDFSFDDKDDAKRLNTGLVAAAGVNFGKVVLDLRYNFGLNNLIDADASNANDNDPLLQTRAIAITAGYKF
ncbi:MAG TPA: outer membrane beta-barrel protein, partial [Saprospiraceae bacterium]|nr:outer membrane beta-barrel protein [Saprospiraceae bacterium]